MKKLKKTYAILHLSEKHTTFHLGKTKVHVSFTGGQVTKNGVTPATFTTDNPIVQLAIERSKAFAEGAVTLVSQYPVKGEVKIGMNPRKSIADLVSEAAAPGEADGTGASEGSSDTGRSGNRLPIDEGGVEEGQTGESSVLSLQSSEGTADEGEPGNPQLHEGRLENRLPIDEDSPMEEDEESPLSTDGLMEVEVSCKDVAKQYLQDHFDERPAPLRTWNDVQECAAKHGIIFKSPTLE